MSIDIEILSGLDLGRPLGLIQLFTHAQVSTQHPHLDISIYININNNMVNSRIQVKSYAEGDHVEIRSRPERFSLRVIKKLYACKARPLKVVEIVDPSAYVLKSSLDLDTSSTFNI